MWYGYEKHFILPIYQFLLHLLYVFKLKYWKEIWIKYLRRVFSLWVHKFIDILKQKYLTVFNKIDDFRLIYLSNKMKNLKASMAKVISVLEFDHDLQHLYYESCKHWNWKATFYTFFSECTSQLFPFSRLLKYNEIYTRAIMYQKCKS